MSVLKMERKSSRTTPDLETRIARRYLQEKEMIQKEVDGVRREGEDDDGPEENHPDPFYPSECKLGLSISFQQIQRPLEQIKRMR